MMNGLPLIIGSKSSVRIGRIWMRANYIKNYVFEISPYKTLTCNQMIMSPNPVGTWIKAKRHSKVPF